MILFNILEMILIIQIVACVIAMVISALAIYGVVKENVYIMIGISVLAFIGFIGSAAYDTWKYALGCLLMAIKTSCYSYLIVKIGRQHNNHVI